MCLHCFDVYRTIIGQSFIVSLQYYEIVCGTHGVVQDA